MKPTRLQFDVRENTASSRRHASRSAVKARSNVIWTEEESHQTQRPAERLTRSNPRLEDSLESTIQDAATGGNRRAESRLLTVQEVADLLHVPVSWVYGRMRKRSLERLPGFRLGKYWRFSKREVLAWVNSQREGPHAA